MEDSISSGDRQDTFEQRVRGVEWADYDTAYGNAAAMRPSNGRPHSIADLLLQVQLSDTVAAIRACADLDGSVCHQHVMIHSAALPALPFILEILDRHPPADLVDEITFLLSGLAETTRPVWLRANLSDPATIPDWTQDIRRLLQERIPQFHDLSRSSHPGIAENSNSIMSYLSQG